MMYLRRRFAMMTSMMSLLTVSAYVSSSTTTKHFRSLSGSTYLPRRDRQTVFLFSCKSDINTSTSTDENNNKQKLKNSRRRLSQSRNSKKKKHLSSSSSAAAEAAVSIQTKRNSPSNQETKWNDRYQELVEFYQINNHSNVPYNHPNSKLSRWVTNQRQNKKLNRRSMTQERIDKLNDVQFIWETRCTWEDRFQELKEYSLLYGDCNVLPSTNLDLSRFVSSQRRQYKLYRLQEKNYNDSEFSNRTSSGSPPSKISLNEKKIEALISIGFEFDKHENPNDSAWMAKFDQLKQFQQQHNHCFVPCKDKNLRGWIDAQRTAYRISQKEDGCVGGKGGLSKKRYDMLNTLNFVWDPMDAKFKERIEEIKKFRALNGHCVVSIAENPSLHAWMKKQQIQYRKAITGEKSSLTQDRIHQLQSVDAVDLNIRMLNLKQSPDKTPWTLKFNQLKAFAKEHGHCRVPQKHPELGEFVKTQRYSYKQMAMGKKSSMTPEKVDKLNAIGFEWNVNVRTQPLRRIAVFNTLQRSRSSSRTINEVTKRNSEDLLQLYERRSLWGV